MSACVEKQATGRHAVSVQILTFRLVTLKVAHQFDVLVDVFEAFQLVIVVNDFHWVLENLVSRAGWKREGRNKAKRNAAIICWLYSVIIKRSKLGHNEAVY